MAENEKSKYEFVMRCEMERFGTLKIGYTQKDLDKLQANIGPKGWGNTRVKFHKDTNKPFMVLVAPVDKSEQPDKEPLPEEKKPWEKPVEPPVEAPQKKLPF